MEAECLDRNGNEHQSATSARPPRPPPPQVALDFNSYQNLQKLHDKAYHFSNQGITAEENEDNNLALTSYKRGLELLNKALTVDCEKLRDANSDQIDKAKLLQQKMTKSKMQIEYRIQELEREMQPQPSQASLMELDSPPSYDEAMTIGDSIMSSDSISSNTDSLISNAEQLFIIPEGVQLFYITPEGFVSAPSYPSTLRLCKFSEEAAVGATNAAPPPPAFLQVGNWIYPLIPDTSPALQTSYGAYIFPDTLSQVPGSTVGVMFPETVSADERRTFEEILSSLTVMKEQQTEIRQADLTLPSAPSVWEAPPVEPIQPSEPVITQPSHVQEPVADTEAPKESTSEDTSTKISKGIMVAADWLAWGFGKGAEKANNLIKSGSQRLQKHINPAEHPSHIDPKVQKGFTYARKGTHVAVSVSSYVVSKLGAATVMLGKQLAPHVKKHGEKLLPKALTKDNTGGKSKMSGVFEVTVSGIKGFSTVYLGLESAAKSLAKNLANETVVVVNHRYGQEAGALTDNTLYTFGNVAMAAYNIDNLGVKAMAKRAVKDTGKAVIYKYAEEYKVDRPDGKSVSISNTSVYPNIPGQKQ